MKHKMVKTPLSISVLLLLAACGGGSDSTTDNSNNGDGGTDTTPTNATVKGLAIDGYVEGSTAFLDYNFNGVMDNNEPSDITDQNGHFEFEVAEEMATCKNYTPVIIDVPVGAYDSDYGVVEKPYRLTFPPTFSSDNVSESLLATTPFTTAIWSAVEADILAQGIQNCHELANNKELQKQVLLRVRDKEYELANRYNIPVEEIYSDFIANGNTHQHQLAQILTQGLSKSYIETAAIQEANPNAWRATVEYYVLENENGDYTDWYREERVMTAEEHSLNVFEVSSDLTTIGKLITQNISEQVATGDIQKYRQDMISYLPELDKYACGISNNFKENREVFGDDVITFFVSTSALVDSYQSCADPNTYSDSTPTASIFRELYQGNNLIQSGQWGFDKGMDGTIDALINDGLYSDITDANKLLPFRSWDYSFSSTEAYGSRDWTRTSIITNDKGAHVITDFNSEGIWIVRTTYLNGTHKTECGPSLDSLAEVAHIGMCES